MMRLVVAAALLWCSAGADEYGAGMPHYGDSADYASVPLTGSAVLDYRGQSPDAPAPFDYKYEEEHQGNTEKSSMDTAESDIWHKPAKKHRGLRHNRDEPSESEVDAEPLPKSKSNRRKFPRYPSHLADIKSLPQDLPVRRYQDEPVPRLQDKPSHRLQDEFPRSRRERHGRSREETDLPLEYLDKIDYRVDKHENLDDVDTFSLRVTTGRIIRRKPRDRLFSNYVKPLKSDDLDLEEDLLERKPKSEQLVERTSTEREKPMITRDPPRYRPALPGDTDIEEDDIINRSRPKAKLYSEYDEYYDMKRLRLNKNKLPMLFRKTTTSPPNATTLANLLRHLWTLRRRAGGDSGGAVSAGNAGTVSSDSGDSASLIPTRSTTRVSFYEPPSPTEAATVTATIIATTISTSFSDSSSELSIAEKSRLSIMKKMQKKESDKNDSSKKPPVLMQVTKKVQTVVIVEPSTMVNPWMRARHILKETPQNLEKVKRMMRHKLVAGAKGIQDLTDNWDDMVCDYVDVSLLNFAAAHKTWSLTLPCVTFVFVI